MKRKEKSKLKIERFHLFQISNKHDGSSGAQSTVAVLLSASLIFIHIVFYLYEIGKVKYLKTERFIYTMKHTKYKCEIMVSFIKHFAHLGLICTFLMGFLPPITKCK